MPQYIDRADVIRILSETPNCMFCQDVVKIIEKILAVETVEMPHQETRKGEKMPRYIDADALKPDYIVPSTSTGSVNRQYVSLFQILNAPTVEAVPWEKLERYAEFFCADVPYTEFVREAKLFLEGENGEREEGSADGQE